MTFKIGIEDLVANAMIETLNSNINKRFLSYEEIENYGDAVVHFFDKQQDAKVILILSRDRTNQALRNYSDFFEEQTINTISGIKLKEDKTVDDLVNQFRGYLSYDLLLAFIKSYKKKASKEKLKEVKLFKDPIYGYISISQSIVKEIINTPYFQRLRHISQTSYAPLYPSATHNRFVHSIGVYHLGELAGNSILEKTDACLFSELQLLTRERVFEIFNYACILHDIGHAPFSHTGEMFYLNAKDDYSELHRELNSLINDDSFSDDCPKTNSESAAPHEIMSAIIGIKFFESLFESNMEKSFFARCITGYLYKEATTDKKILNCFISLLNSNIIDVDKLDYLMRDSYTSGFESVKIDYVRLLSALKITQDDETHFYLAYEKNALSVIENVVYAHDAEKKWIQSHPIVLYESYLLQHSLLQLVKDLKLKKNTDLFCSAALSEDGIKLLDGTTINLLCDTDIVFLLKNKYRNTYFSEYLNRNMWRKPLWKSESEYAMLFLLKMGQEPSKKFTSAMTSAAEYVDKNTSQGVINEELYNSLCEDLKKIETPSDIDTKTNKIQIIQKKKIQKIINILKEFSKNTNIPFDYILIKQSQFISGFGKEDFSKIKIEFRGEKARLVNFGEVAAPLTQEKLAKDDFYYIYCPNSKEIPKDILIKELRNSFIDD